MNINSTRLRIIACLGGGAVDAAVVSDATGIHKDTVYLNLRKMHKVGILEVERTVKNPRKKLYTVKDEEIINQSKGLLEAFGAGHEF